MNSSSSIIIMYASLWQQIRSTIFLLTRCNIFLQWRDTIILKRLYNISHTPQSIPTRAHFCRRKLRLKRRFRLALESQKSRITLATFPSGWLVMCLKMRFLLTADHLDWRHPRAINITPLIIFACGVAWFHFSFLTWECTSSFFKWDDTFIASAMSCWWALISVSAWMISLFWVDSVHDYR